jgi:transposase
MAYSKDTREMVLNYLDKGHTYKEANEELGVSISAMQQWKRRINAIVIPPKSVTTNILKTPTEL